MPKTADDNKPQVLHPAALGQDIGHGDAGVVVNKDGGAVEGVGGGDATPTAANVGEYIDIIKDKTLLRRVSVLTDVEVVGAQLVDDLGDTIKSCGSYQIKAKLGYEISGTVNVLVVEG